MGTARGSCGCGNWGRGQVDWGRGQVDTGAGQVDSARGSLGSPGGGQAAKEDVGNSPCTVNKYFSTKEWVGFSMSWRGQTHGSLKSPLWING